MADQLVLSKFSDAKFKYYDTALAACLAVKDGEADAAAYDQPILKNIAAKNDGLIVLAEMITVDDYGFAVALGNDTLKAAVRRGGTGTERQRGLRQDVGGVAARQGRSGRHRVADPQRHRRACSSSAPRP